MASIKEQLAQLPLDMQTLLERHHFDPARFERLAARLRSGPVDHAAENRVRGSVEPPRPDDVSDLPASGSREWLRLEAKGLEALGNGHCALVVLAGGMATRMGGVVKALVEALPGRTFLDLRLAEMQALEKRVGRRVPLWLMSSHATDAALREALGDHIDGESVAVFPQSLSLRLTPGGDLFHDAAGKVSEHAPGHGDLPDALRESGLLGRFVQRGGRMLMMANLDNLGATVDPAVIGWHLAQQTQVTCEVVDKVGSDRGGVPVRLDGRPVVLEEFRLPEGFDPAQVRVFNTNTFHFDARALDELDMDWTFFAVNKKVDEQPVIQFERLVGEVTSHLETRFLRVSRQGGSSRFLPVKDPAELEARRPEIEAVARARGFST
jgi:UTP--glucose-1-phosphate uridylyltransferase